MDQVGSMNRDKLKRNQGRLHKEGMWTRVKGVSIAHEVRLVIETSHSVGGMLGVARC